MEIKSGNCNLEETPEKEDSISVYFLFKYSHQIPLSVEALFFLNAALNCTENSVVLLLYMKVTVRRSSFI